MKRAIQHLGLGTLAALLAFSGAIPVVTTAQAAPWNTWDNGPDRQDLRSFSDFLTNHPWIANQLWQKPSRANSKDFQEDNKELKYYLKDHPRVREELREDARGVMSRMRDFQGNRGYRGDRDDYYRGDRDDHNGDNGYGYSGASRAEVARFNQFLDDHSKIARDLHKNPSLVNNSDYVEDHKPLRDFLRANPAVWNALRDNPRAFMNGYRDYGDRGDD